MKSIHSFDRHHHLGGVSKEELGTLIILLESKVEWLEKHLAKLEESVKGLQRQLHAFAIKEETIERRLVQSPEKLIHLPRRQEARPPPQMGECAGCSPPGDHDRIQKLAVAARELYEGWATTPEEPEMGTEYSGCSPPGDHRTQKLAVAARELYEGWATTPDASEASEALHPARTSQLRELASDDDDFGSGRRQRPRSSGKTMLLPRLRFGGACFKPRAN
ncbi:hypothetical protein H6P81_017228 [Aristolochia fimbriata]|uniref:Uncharacterized protein n=1 Tax=Aristolochia fimbriata TaxID=158543 RepID=A0AAV7DYI9_ARIFI|nr:hypothetical protein H6P81_017228 [Aristolochia fimbriata]